MLTFIDKVQQYKRDILTSKKQNTGKNTIGENKRKRKKP